MGHNQLVRRGRREPFDEQGQYILIPGGVYDGFVSQYGIGLRGRNTPEHYAQHTHPEHTVTLRNRVAVLRSGGR